jgi:hypothetical protein
MTGGDRWQCGRIEEKGGKEKGVFDVFVQSSGWREALLRAYYICRLWRNLRLPLIHSPNMQGRFLHQQ